MKAVAICLAPGEEVEINQSVASWLGPALAWQKIEASHFQIEVLNNSWSTEFCLPGEVML